MARRRWWKVSRSATNYKREVVSRNPAVGQAHCERSADIPPGRRAQGKEWLGALTGRQQVKEKVCRRAVVWHGLAQSRARVSDVWARRRPSSAGDPGIRRVRTSGVR